MEAAFFDLDRTVISKPSIMAFAADFRRQGLLPRRALLLGLWHQLLYMRLGASEKRMERARTQALNITRGWPREQVRSTVSGRLAEAVDPITYVDALRLIDEHRRAGRRIYLVSAAPAEVVEPLAERLRVDASICSIARTDDQGLYTGELEVYAYGPEKATLMQRLADGEGIDLSESFAYSDSATDLPMLEATGHPVAVNPDRSLRRVARKQGWEVLRFEETLPGAEPSPGVSGRSRRLVWARRGSAAAAVLAAAGGAAAIAWRTRSEPIGAGA